MYSNTSVFCLICRRIGTPASSPTKIKWVGNKQINFTCFDERRLMVRAFRFRICHGEAVEGDLI